MNLTDQLWYYLADDGYWDLIADPRVSHFPLINGGIWKILLIMSSYLTITRVLLPKYMQQRNAFELRSAMLCYNLIMVTCNAVVFYWVVVALDYGRIFLDFRYPSCHDKSPSTLWFLNFIWWFWMIRFMDLLDTVFFVLRKKEGQITTLHLYHHTVVPILFWVTLKHNGMIPIVRMFCVINSFIHGKLFGLLFILSGHYI